MQSLAVTNGYEEDYNFSSFGIISPTDPDPNIQKFMADAKKALVIENKFVMNVKPEVYDWPKGYMSEEYEKYYPVKQAESK